MNMKATPDYARMASRFLLAAAVVMLGVAGWRVWTRPALWWSLRPAAAVPAAAGPSGGLLVVYQARDCASYAAFIQRWQGVHAPGDFEVTGVPLDAGSKQAWARRTLEDLAPGYPVRPDLASRAADLLGGLGNLPTPVAIVIDRQGRPRMVLGATADPRDLSAARDLVLAYRSHEKELSR